MLAARRAVGMKPFRHQVRLPLLSGEKLMFDANHKELKLRSITRKIFAFNVTILFMIVVIGVSYSKETTHKTASIEILIEQINEENCYYKYERGECTERPFWDVLDFISAPKRHCCVSWAAACLGTLESSARAAVPHLTKALREGPNDFDTGEGTVGSRTSIAQALRRIGDPSAIPALIAGLDHAEPVQRSYGATKNQPLAAQYEILEALGSFGSKANSAEPSIVKLLKKHNAEALRIPTPHQLNMALWSLEASTTSFPVWVHRNYRTDQVAEMAAETLGKIGATETVPLLIEILQNKWATCGAAEGLGLLGEPARIAIPNLRKVLRPDNNPSQRQAAAKTLGLLGDIASLIEIAKGLEDDALFNGFIESIKYFGSAADPAVDILSKRLERPIEVVLVDKSVHYGVNAGRELHRQIEVIETFGLIGTTKAFDALANSLTNPDLGDFACKEMQKLDRGKGDLNRIIAKIPAEEIQRYKDLSSYVNPCFKE